jgi:hypothetical protein
MKKDMDEDDKIEKILTPAGSFAIGIIAVFCMACIMAFPFQYFWNNVLIEVSTILKEINYWQSVSTIIFIFFIGRLFNFSGNK